jgi:hypothetical protein
MGLSVVAAIQSIEFHAFLGMNLIPAGGSLLTRAGIAYAGWNQDCNIELMMPHAVYKTVKPMVA